MVKYLLSHKADYKVCDEKTRNIISKAVLTGHHEIILFLKNFLPEAEFKFLLRQQDNDGRTALHLCILYDQIKCCEYLLEFGIDTEILDQTKTTAFQFAAKLEKEVFLQILKKNISIDDRLNFNLKSHKTEFNLSQEKEKINKKQLQQVFLLI